VFEFLKARQPTNVGKKESMRCTFSVATVVLGVLLPSAVAFAASTHAKRYHWHGYGFLPGYHQPPNPNEVHYGPNEVNYGAPRYYYGGGLYYFGGAGFAHGRWNGGSFGPCWTYTPIGRMWNCG
jgi:hypothetical protein